LEIINSFPRRSSLSALQAEFVYERACLLLLLAGSQIQFSGNLEGGRMRGIGCRANFNLRVNIAPKDIGCQ